MPKIPAPVAAFLEGKRIAVAGVSRSGASPANAILRKLQAAGYEVFSVNPNAETLDGLACFPDVGAIPGAVDGVIVATHPDVAEKVARDALAKGARHIWFHRSFGEGSVSAAALQACRAQGVEPIEGGCPLMYCPPVDLGHRFFRWWLARKHRIPA